MSEPPTLVSSEQSPTVFRLPKLDGAHLTLGLATLYVLGFIVANVHLGKYELLRLELLRARYVSAALLFVACSAIPFGLGVFLSNAAHDAVVPRGRNRTRAEISAFFSRLRPIQLAVTILFVYPVYLLLMWQMSVGFAAVRLPATEYFAFCAVITWFATDFYVDTVPSAQSPVWGGARLIMHACQSCLFVIGLPAVFSGSVYEVIRQEFAGGVAWVAQVTLSDSSSAIARDFAVDTVAIIDRDEETLSMLVCRKRDKQIERAILPVNGIADIRLRGQIAAADFSCRRGP